MQASHIKAISSKCAQKCADVELLTVLVYLAISKREAEHEGFLCISTCLREDFSQAFCSPLYIKTGTLHLSRFGEESLLNNIQLDINLAALLNPSVCFHGVYRVGMCMEMQCIQRRQWAYIRQFIACIVMENFGRKCLLPTADIDL